MEESSAGGGGGFSRRGMTMGFFYSGVVVWFVDIVVCRRASDPFFCCSGVVGLLGSGCAIEFAVGVDGFVQTGLMVRSVRS